MSNTVDISVNGVFVTSAHSDSSVLRRCHNECALELHTDTFNVSTFVLLKTPLASQESVDCHKVPPVTYT
jgi:hypothetical protein